MLATLSRNFQLQFLRPVLGRADVELALYSGSAEELLRALTALRIDLFLTNQAPQADALTSLVVRRLDEQPVSLIGVAALRAPRTPLQRRLESTPLIVPGKSSGVRMGFDALVDRLGVRPNIAAEVDDMAMMRLLVREGAGLGVLPPIVVRDELKAGALSEIAKLPKLTEGFFGVAMKRRFPNPILRDLLNRGELRRG
jgi:LysR family transcriptional regulator, transcriptional activator of nhaA